MMILWLAAIAALAVFRCRLVPFHDGFLERDTTDSVKGIFILIVLLSHARGYVSVGGGTFNALYLSFFSRIGQLMVAMFLFYSGYGCFESYKKKTDYLGGFLKKRVVKTLFNFAAALVLYVIVNAALRIRYSAKEYLLCWIGWESIGNSNWYIFTIVALYLMVWLGFKLEQGRAVGKGLICIPVTSLLCVAFIFLMHRAGKESWWYDTSLCFPFGMMVSFSKEFILRRIRRTGEWALWTAAVAAVFLLTYAMGGLWYFICACLFCLLVVLITSRAAVGNAPLIWLGRHLFEIYILQRIPMIILEHCSVSDPMLFTAVSIAATLLLAEFFHRALARLNTRLFS